jgi:uncharacterized membrane protein
MYTAMQPPLVVDIFLWHHFYLLFWLTLITAASRRFLKIKTLFTGAELIFTWGLMLLVSGIAYTGFARTFFINLTAPYYFATFENHWQSIIQPLLPDTLFPRGPAAIDQLYNGIENGQAMGLFELISHIPWAAWVLPFLSWGIFMVTAYLLILCLVHMISRQAMENERMNFPLLIVPKMIQEALDDKQLSTFFGNRFLLMGLSVPICLHLLNGLHFLFSIYSQHQHAGPGRALFPQTGAACRVHQA